MRQKDDLGGPERTRFDWNSWMKAAKSYSDSATAVSTVATVDIPPLVGAWDGTGTSTLLDAAIDLIFGVSVPAIAENISQIGLAIGEDSLALMETGFLYQSIEANNQLTAGQVDTALAETPFNAPQEN